jgi:hypothetical protein
MIIHDPQWFSQWLAVDVHHCFSARRNSHPPPQTKSDSGCHSHHGWQRWQHGCWDWGPATPQGCGLKPGDREKDGKGITMLVCCMCIYIYIHWFTVVISLCIFIYLSIYLFIHLFIYLYIYLYIYIFIYLYIYIFICLFIYLFIYVNVCMHACMYVFMYSCIYIHVCVQCNVM